MGKVLTAEIIAWARVLRQKGASLIRRQTADLHTSRKKGMG